MALCLPQVQDMAATFIPTGLGREREPSDKESRLMGELRRLADKCAKE